MLATQEAQVIPTTQMKHLWALVSFPEVACDPVPLLTPGLFDDAKWGRSDGPELTGHDFSWLWVLFANSVEKKEQNNPININEWTEYYMSVWYNSTTSAVQPHRDTSMAVLLTSI